jgi:rRNA maturation protein Rpf1
MPYITFSRNIRVPRRTLLDTCMRLGALFKHSVVVMRGCKSVKALASDAASRGFSSVIVLQGGSAQKLAILNPKSLGSGYTWGKEYALKLTKSKLTIERGGKDAQKTLIREARD